MLMVNVLGETELVTAGGPVAPGGPLARRLLTLLALFAGRTVSDARIEAALWGDDPPTKAAASVQAYVSRLRRVLGADDADRLVRRQTGYALLVDATDAAELSTLTERAAAALAAGHSAEAARSAESAVALWRGTPYVDLAGDRDADAEAVRLTELRETAVETGLAARLQQGRDVVADLDAAARAAPYRERRWALLVLALYRGGRQADALAVLRRVRSMLADELGVDPGQELQDLERRVLGQDPGLLLQVDAPPPGTAAPPPAGAPGAADAPRVRRPMTTLLGREAELAQLAGLLDRQRLVTVVGPGGAGKTRLALESAAAFPDRRDVWFARLADTADPTLVPTAVARAVGLAETLADATAATAAAVGSREAVLLVDNCEHVVGSVADLAVTLLDRCPGLRVLATSREPLGVDGEVALELRPLPVLDPGGGDGAAVALLVERVGQVRPGWTPTPDERADARRLCQALDGLPLAIELAAARTRAMSLRDLADRLVDDLSAGLDALAAVPRGSLSPHATLAATVAWSTALLSRRDRELLTLLWPFSGGFDVEAAVRASGAGDASVLDSLSSLVSKSLVAADVTVTPTRYRLWEPVRAYVREHDPDPAATRRAHAEAVHAMAVHAAAQLTGAHSAHAMTVLDRELANIRAGLHHDLTHAPARAMHTFGALEWFWYRCGMVAEGIALAEAILAAAPDADPVDRARVWAARTTLSYLGGDVEQSLESLANARALLEGSDHPFRGQVLYYAAVADVVLGDPAAGQRHAMEAAEIGARAGDPVLESVGRMSLGMAQLAAGDRAAGEASLATAKALAHRGQHRWSEASCDQALARYLLADHPPQSDRAAGAVVSALEMFAAEADSSNVVACAYLGVAVLVLNGRPAAAGRLLRGVRRTASRLGIDVARMETAVSADIVAAAEAETEPQPSIPGDAGAAAIAGIGDLLELVRSVGLVAAPSTDPSRQERRTVHDRPAEQHQPA